MNIRLNVSHSLLRVLRLHGALLSSVVHSQQTIASLPQEQADDGTKALLSNLIQNPSERMQVGQFPTIASHHGTSLTLGKDEVADDDDSDERSKWGQLWVVD